MSNQTKYSGIQITRFVAACVVLIYHAWHFTAMRGGVQIPEIEIWLASLGRMGVILFFSISGFVLTHALQNASSGQFLRHRFLRIYPPFWGAILLVVGIKLAIWGSYPWGDDFIKSLFLIPVGSIPYPLSIEWSLIYEVFFYCVLSIIWLKRSNKVLLYFSICWMGVILITAIVKPAVTSMLPMGYSIFFSAFNMAFIGGVLGYFIHKRISDRFFSIALIGSFALLMFSVHVSAVSGIILVSLGTSILITLIANRDWKRVGTVRGRTFKEFGDYSYGIYLIHASVIDVISSAFFQRGIWIDPITVAFVALSLGLLFGAAEFRFYQYARVLIDNSLSKDKPVK